MLQPVIQQPNLLKWLISLFLVATAHGQVIGPINGGTTGGNGTVTQFSFSNNNGLTGTVTNPTTTPELTLSLDNGSVVAGKLSLSTTQRLLGRNTSGAGAGEEFTVFEALDWIGSGTGMLLIRDSIDWTALPAPAGVSILYHNGTGTSPFWFADDTQHTPAKGQPNGYAGLDSGGKVPTGQLPSFEVQSNKGAVNGYAPLGSSQKVPSVNLGTGGDGSGTHFLGDDQVFHGISSTAGGTVTSITLTMPSDFTVAGSPITTSGTFGITRNVQSAYSWFGNATASNAVPAYNTTAIPIQLMPAFSGGDVTNSAGSGTLTIGNGAVSFTKLQNVGAFSVAANPTSGAASATSVTVEGGSFSGTTMRLYKPAQSLSGTTPTVDAATAKSFFITLSGITTFTFSGFNDGDSIVVRCQQAASGGPYTVVFPTATWQGGSQPTQTAVASKSDFYEFTKQGATIYAAAIQNF